MKTTKTILLIAGSVLALVTASCSSTSASNDPHAGHKMTATNTVKPYTKDTCIVTDNKLGSMGDPITLVHNGQEVKFCCKPCVAKFKANPERFLSKL
ncbi:MAG: hypothetical protein ACON5H_06585 [Akkermansiaceae bacterium]